MNAENQPSSGGLTKKKLGMALYAGSILQADPSQKVRAVVGFGDNSISQALQPFLTDDELPQVGTREDLNDFGDKVGIRAGMLTCHM